MRYFGKALIGLSLLLCAGQAAATRTITVSFNAVGTGLQVAGYGSQGAILEPLQAVSVSVVFSGSDNSYYSDNAGAGIRLVRTAEGLKFVTDPFGPSYYEFRGSATLCGVTFDVGSRGIDPACSPIAFNSSFPSGFGRTFQGFVQDVTIVEGANPIPIQITGFVPEPSTWALMLAGFALTGNALRRRRTVAFA